MSHSDYSDEDVDVICDENGDQEFEEATDSEGDPDELDYDVDIEGNESDYIDECTVNVSHFDLIKKLGTGAYGTVFLVRKNCGFDVDKIYALKVINKALVVKVSKSIVHMKAERKALEILRHCPYIQKLYYAFQTADKLFLVTEYLPGGEMFTQVQKGPLPEHQVRFYIAELIVALEHIHLHGIVYRDIKLENVLLDADGHVKLVDFGLCKKLGIRGRSKSFCGTEEYMAPEVVACTGHNSAADWWALGVLAIELLSTITPFGNSDAPNSIMDKITNDDPIMPPNISDEMEDFLLKLLTKDPTERLGGSEALATKLKQHRLFRDIDWEKLENKLLPSPVIPTILFPTDTQNFSEEFTSEDPTYEPSEVPPNSFLTFKGYSYIAPDLIPSQMHQDDNFIDENLNSLTRHILNQRDPDSKFYQKYRFESHQPLGSGKSSVCMKCVNLSDGTCYAVKIYKRQEQNNIEIDVLQKAAAKRLPGVLHLIEVLTDKKWTYLIMELVDGISLLEHFSTLTLNGKIVFETFNALWEIVKSVHTLKYAHGRICFQNFCYLRSSCEFRLIGFSNAKPITVAAKDEQIDYWSLGVLIYTVLCGHSPFNLSTSNVTSKMIHRIETDDFDQNSKQWNALHKDIRCFIDQLLRSSIPTCSKEELKKIRNTSVRAVNWSKEQLDEHKSIIEIRAIKALTMKTQTNIKVEMIPVSNGMNLIANGVDSIQIHEEDVKCADGNKVHQSRTKESQEPNEPNRRNESRTKNAQVNGHIKTKPNSKRRNDQADEQNGPSKHKAKKLKKDNVQAEPIPITLLKPEEIKQERQLRNLKPVNYAQKLNPRMRGNKSVPETKPEPVEIKDDEIKPPQPNPKNKIKENTRTKGRPKKDQSNQPVPAKPKKTRKRAAPAIPEKHSAPPPTQPNVSNTKDEKRWIGERPMPANVQPRYNCWVYNYPRPVRMGPVNYVFERFDY